MPWSNALARKTIVLTQQAGRRLLGHNAINAEMPWCEKYLDMPTQYTLWYDTMLTHYAANMHLTKMNQKSEDDDNEEGSGAIGLMDLWSAVRCLPLPISSWVLS